MTMATTSGAGFAGIATETVVALGWGAVRTSLS